MANMMLFRMCAVSQGSTTNRLPSLGPWRWDGQSKMIISGIPRIEFARSTMYSMLVSYREILASVVDDAFLRRGMEDTWILQVDAVATQRAGILKSVLRRRL